MLAQPYAGSGRKRSCPLRTAPAALLLVNTDMKLAELGWIKFPKLINLGWAARWLQYVRAGAYCMTSCRMYSPAKR